MAKYIIFDFRKFFKNETTEIRHLELFQKIFFYDLFVFESKTKRKIFFN
jgi:hypothetical protein